MMCWGCGGESGVTIGSLRRHSPLCRRLCVARFPALTTALLPLPVGTGTVAILFRQASTVLVRTSPTDDDVISPRPRLRLPRGYPHERPAGVQPRHLVRERLLRSSSSGERRMERPEQALVRLRSLVRAVGGGGDGLGRGGRGRGRGRGGAVGGLGAGAGRGRGGGGGGGGARAGGGRGGAGGGGWAWRWGRRRWR